MSSKISALATLNVVTDNDYLVLARTTDSSNYKYPANSLFTTLVGIGYDSPVYLIDSISSTNALSQKGIKSGSSILTVASTASNGDKNILFNIVESAIDLSLCDNSTSGFLTSVDLSAASGVVPVTNGGTGLSELADKSILVTQDTGTDSLSAIPMVNSGELVIGGASGPTIATLTAGDNVTITNGDGSISIASTFNTATTNINMNSFNLDLDSGWISGDGVDGGISFQSDQLYVGTSANEFYKADTSLNVDKSIVLSSQHAEQQIFVDPSTEGKDLTVLAGVSTGANNNGGDLNLLAGNADGTGTGGSIRLRAGNSYGSVLIQNYISGTVYDSLSIAQNDVTVGEGDLKITKTGKGLEVPAGAASQGSNLTDNVTINEVSGKITLARTGLPAESQAEFTVTNSTVSGNSLVFVSLIAPGAANESVNAIMVAQVSGISNGSFNVTLTNVSATTATDTQLRYLQFFVIN